MSDPADAVAQAALAAPCVARLSGDLATFLPGRRVSGVRVSEDAVEVSVVLRLDGRPLPALADEVRAAVAEAAGGRRVDVTVADVVTDAEDADADADQAGDADAGAPAALESGGSRPA